MRKIIDASYLGAPELRQYFKNSSENKVVLCDYACMEAYKGSPLINLIKSTAILRDFPGQIIILKGTREIVKVTISAYTPAELIDNEQTVEFPKFCDYLRLADGGNELIKEQINNLHRNAQAHFERTFQDAEKFRSGVKAIKNFISLDQLKSFQKSFQQDDPLDSEVLTKIQKGVLNLAAILGTSHPDIDCLPTVEHVRNSYLFRFALCGYVLALHWISKGGISNVKQRKIQSDLIDMSYVAYATLFDGVLTKDRKMEDVYRESFFLLKRAF